MQWKKAAVVHFCQSRVDNKHGAGRDKSEAEPSIHDCAGLCSSYVG